MQPNLAIIFCKYELGKNVIYGYKLIGSLGTKDKVLLYRHQVYMIQFWALPQGLLKLETVHFQV